MSKKVRHHSAEFKFRVALEAIGELKTTSQIASEYDIHPTLIRKWKKQLREEGSMIFNNPVNQKKQEKRQDMREAELYEQIGRLKMELEWLKKKLPDSVEVKRRMIEPKHPELSIRRQCELIGLNRSSFYMKVAPESPLNLELMRQIDEQYLKTPFYGVRRMTVILRRQGYEVNHKRIARLMRTMGLQALFPRKNLSQAAQGHQIYPYLLRNMKIEQVNQVWSTDITYVPMTQGFMYLVAIIDWFSRYVLTWQLSNTLDGAFCLATLKQALANRQPEIFNTDQGAQFTAHDFTQCLLDADVKISMDGKGRALDNIFVERLWRSVKYEDIYLKNYDDVPHLQEGLENYFQFYNHERPHQSLNDRVPAEVYYGITLFPNNQLKTRHGSS